MYNNGTCCVIAFLLCLIPIVILKAKDYIPKTSKKNYIIITSIWAVISIIIAYFAITFGNLKFSLIPVLLSIIVTSIYNYNIINDKINIKNIIKLLIIFLIFMCSDIFQYIPITLFNLDLNTISTNTKTILTLFSDICLLLLLIGIYFNDLKTDFKSFKKNFYKNFDIAFKYWFMGIIIMITSNIIISVFLKSATAVNEQSVQTMIHAAPIASFISAGILAPIIEELTFRKAYFDAFKKNKWLFVITSGLVFGLLHVIFAAKTPIDYIYAIPYTALGISFAAMDFEANNIFPSIMAHMIHNSALIIVSIAMAFLMVVI